MAGRLHAESLEDRLCPSSSYLLVDSFNTNSVLRYDETTGAFVDEFVPKNTGGLYSSGNMDFGPDHNLYVSNGLFSPKNKANNVLRFDGASGALLGDFADSGQLTDPRGVIFGPEGDLYVADGNGSGSVLRYDGQTGAFLDMFVPPGGGGLSHPSAMLFGPDGNLYVLCTDQSEVLCFQGPTGTNPGSLLDTFVSAGSGGLHQPLSMAFGPDENLYVANSMANDPTSGGILRYDGRSGAFLGTFIAPASGGLIKPLSILFGPNGDLFVGSADAYGGSLAKPHTSTVLRYDGTTGDFLGAFVTPDNGGLRYPSQLLFTETDPMTLAFHSGEQLTAASSAARPVNEILNTHQLPLLLAAALARGQHPGVDTSGLGANPLQIIDLGGTTFGLASGRTIWLDDNATGWGWFVDTTPWEDSAYLMPGNQSEQRMDLLTSPEVGRYIGLDHDVDGVMAEALSASQGGR
jgi:hypothetical protein